MINYLLIISPGIHVYVYYMVFAKLLQENYLKNLFLGRSHMGTLCAKTSQWRPLQVAYESIARLCTVYSCPSCTIPVRRRSQMSTCV
jgi:hypothetical protein